MYEETPIVPFNPRLTLDDIEGFTNTNKKSKRLKYCESFYDRDKVKSVTPLPSISRGNLVSPINCPVVGIVRALANKKDKQLAKYTDKGNENQKSIYDEEKTRDLINQKYRKEIFLNKVSPSSKYLLPLSPGLYESTSNYIDFQKVSFDPLPWKPLPSLSRDKKEPIQITKYTEKPRIKYAFGEKTEAHELLEYRLERYRAMKENQLKKQLPPTEHHGQQVKQDKNNTEETPVVNNQLETVESFVNKLKQKDNFIEGIYNDEKQQQITLRVRRKISEGSYDNNTVIEDDLPRLLRYTWKGKVKKLAEYLKDNKIKKKINYQDTQGRTALHMAASWDCNQTLSILLDVDDIDVNLTDGDGKTPLFKAVEIKSTTCVQLLINKGASVRIRSIQGLNPFEYALQHLGDNYLTMIKNMLVEGRMFRDRNKIGQMSFLHQCCLAHKKIPVNEVAKELICSGSDVNHVEGSGKTPLMLAAQADRPVLVELLIKYFADVRHVDEDFKSVLYYAPQNSRCHKLIREKLDQLNPREQRVEQQVQKENETKVVGTRKINELTPPKFNTKTNILNNTKVTRVRAASNLQIKRVRPTTPL